MRRHTWHVLPPSAERVVRCQRRRHLMCTCACVPEHAHGEMSAPKAGPSKQKRHEGASGCIVDEDAEGFSERERSRSASSGTAVPTGARACPPHVGALRAARQGAARRAAPARRDVARLAEVRLVERLTHRRKRVAPTRTDRETRARRGVVIRSEFARVFRARSARVEDAEPHASARTYGVPQEIPRSVRVS